MSARSSFLVLVALAASGCARVGQSPPPAFWASPPSPAPAPLSPGQEALPAPTPAASDSAPALAKIDRAPRAAIAPIPGGEACLGLIQQRGVAFSRRLAERGVPTPVLVNGPIGGVRFFSDATPFIADCRLVFALSELAPELVELGVSQVRFSGAYVYRVKTTGSGRLSLHAHGLAIDVHDIWFGSERLNVKMNYTRGLGRECQPGLPRLNEVVCRVRQRGLFKELLTPDDNADHRDHFHFGLAPLPGEVPPEPPPVVLRQPVRKAPAVSPKAAGAAKPEPVPAREPAPDADEIAPIENDAPAPAPAPEATERPGSLPEMKPADSDAAAP